MQLIECTAEEHSDEIQAILNDAIVHTTAIYDYHPRSAEDMAEWFRAKDEGPFPVLGAVDEAGDLLGFATYGTFRNWAAYQYSVEHSIHVKTASRGQGIGRALMERLIEAAKKQDLHVMIGAIDTQNTASLALHRSLGFTEAGTLRHAGFKFGEWRDLVFVQRILETPVCPVDG